MAGDVINKVTNPPVNGFSDDYELITESFLLDAPLSS